MIAELRADCEQRRNRERWLLLLPGNATGLVERLVDHRAVGLVLGETVGQHGTAVHQLAKAGVTAHAVSQLAAHDFRVLLHFLCMAGANAEVVDQLVAFDSVALIEDVFVDSASGADAAFLGALLQPMSRLIVLLGRGLGCDGQHEQQAQGRDDNTQHGALLIQ